MFRKLVSNLPFSPALVGQLGFYARRLRKEEATRRVGLVLTALALVVQSFAVFSPPEPANAASSADLIRGGVSSVSVFLGHYDNNTNNIKDLFNSLGITRGEIEKTTTKTVNSRDGIHTWGLEPHYSYAQGERTYDAGGRTFYYRPLTLWDQANGITQGVNYTAFVGYSAKVGWFGINKNCANLLLKTQPTPPKNISVCRPGTGVITIRETDKLSTDLASNSLECVPKGAVCRYITINKIDRTSMSVTAFPATEGQVTISSYTFTVRKDSATGQVVATETVKSSGAKATSKVFSLKEPGKYYVSATVTTSIGNTPANPNCASIYTVVPPEMCEINPKLEKNDPACQPCVENPKLWFKDPDCKVTFVSSKTARNLTQSNVDANSVVAQPSDRIEYRITIENTGKVPANVTFQENLSDVLEYATLSENGGGKFDQTKKVLSWTALKLEAGQKQSRTFAVTVMATIPSAAQGVSNPTSYDCVMNNTFGNNLQVKVKCDTPKIVETTVAELPRTGPRENMIFAATLLAIVSFFWARSRQLGKEVRLVRKDFSASAIQEVV